MNTNFNPFSNTICTYSIEHTPPKNILEMSKRHSSEFLRHFQDISRIKCIVWDRNTFSTFTSLNHRHKHLFSLMENEEITIS